MSDRDQDGLSFQKRMCPRRPPMSLASWRRLAPSVRRLFFRHTRRPAMPPSADVSEMRKALRQSRNIIAVTGAGLSAASGASARSLWLTELG